MWHERRVLWIQMVAINFLIWEGIAYGGPHIFIKVTTNISDHKDQGITIPGTNNISVHEDQGTTVPGDSNSNEMTNVINGSQDQGVSYSNEIKGNQDQDITVPDDTKSNEMTNVFNSNQDQGINTPDYSEHNTSCSTPQSTQTGGGTNGDKTSDPNQEPSTKNVVSYWIIGIACGTVLLLIVIAVILPYKLYKREQPDPECSQQIPSPQNVPPDDMSHLYAKVQKEKSKENLPSAVDDVNYSAVKFSKEVPTNKVEQSATDYSEIKCP